jgi:hypothetical protein
VCGRCLSFIVIIIDEGVRQVFVSSPFSSVLLFVIIINGGPIIRSRKAVLDQPAGNVVIRHSSSLLSSSPARACAARAEKEVEHRTKNVGDKAAPRGVDPKGPTMAADSNGGSQPSENWDSYGAVAVVVVTGGVVIRWFFSHYQHRANATENRGVEQRRRVRSRDWWESTNDAEGEAGHPPLVWGLVMGRK